MKTTNNGTRVELTKTGVNNSNKEISMPIGIYRESNP